MNFAFANIFNLNNVSFGVDKVKVINSMYSLTVMTEDFPNYGQDVFTFVSVTPEKVIGLYSLQLSLISTLISFCVIIFCKRRVLNLSKLFRFL